MAFEIESVTGAQQKVDDHNDAADAHEDILASLADPFDWSVAASVPIHHGTIAYIQPVRAANEAMFLRLATGSKTAVSKLAIQVGTSSGNLSLAVCSGPSGREGPTTRLATTGAVACPAIGYAEVALDVSVTPAAGDWFAISADNTTLRVAGVASFDLVTGSISLGMSARQAIAHPVPAFPSTGNAVYNNSLIVGAA